jgi:N-acetylglutamate synthase-like GNAT family acetyltransferase
MSQPQPQFDLNQIAVQIAALVNEHNNLTREIKVTEVFEIMISGYATYAWIGTPPTATLEQPNVVRACAKLTMTQWYQAEISHLVVHPDHRGCGLGQAMVENVCETAREHGARIAQCTIVVGNEASEHVFTKCGFVPTVTFFNERSGNLVTVYQKVLVPVPSFDDEGG